MSPVARKWVPLGAFLVLAVTGTAVASPQPANVCGACGDAFEDVASEQGILANVTHSTATVFLHENGSATWVVTNRVNESAADRFAESPASLDRVARAAATEGRGAPDGRKVSGQSVAASVDGRTVSLRFRERNASESRLGLTVGGTLHRGGIRGGWLLNADRFTVVGPPGTELVNEPNETIDADYQAAIPTVDGRRVTWRGPATEWGSFIHENVYLVYGAPETGEYRTDAAVALATAPVWLENVRWYVLPPTAVYGFLLLGVAAVVRRIGSADPGRLGSVVAGVGLGGIVAAALAQRVHEPAWFGGLAAVYLVTGIVARRRPDLLRSVRGSLLVAVIAAGAAGLVALAVEPIGWPRGGAAHTALEQAMYHLPVAVAPAFGLAVTGSRIRSSAGRLTGAFGGAGLAFIAAGAVRVPFDYNPVGFLILYIGAGAVVAGLFAVPLAVLAARVKSDTD